MSGQVLRRAAAVVLGVLVLGVLGASWLRAGGSHEDARVLTGRLAALPGVAAASGEYAESDIPFAGSSRFHVRMERDATPDEVLAVVATAYDDFGGTMRRHSANLAVETGGNLIAVYTEGPDADESDVLDVVRFALGLPASGEKVESGIYALDHGDLGDLDTDIYVRLPRGTTATDVTRRLEEIEASGELPADTDLDVLAADGSALGGSRGLPTAADALVWQELRNVELPGHPGVTTRIGYGPYQIYSGMREYGAANVTVRTSGGRLTTEELRPLIREHRRILAAHHEKYVYNLTVNGEDRVWLRARGDA